MNRPLKTLLLSLIFLSLTHCATTMHPPQNQPLSWAARTRTLTPLTQWQLSGAVGVITSQESVSANLIWIQQNGHYIIRLLPLFGSHAMTLTGYPGYSALTLSNGQQFVASSPEILLAQQTALHLPVSDLFYWVRGLPAPMASVVKQLDAYQHLMNLQQQGWNIRYLQYTAVNGVDLPSKMLLTNPVIRVKLVIKQWNIN